MKRYMLLLLCLPSLAAAMEQPYKEKQKVNTLLHLKQVLVAGRYCYGDHVAIHADAKQRSKEIAVVCRTTDPKVIGSQDRALLAQKLDVWHQIMCGVLAVYAQHERSVDDNLKCLLEQSQSSLGKWVTLLKSNEEIDTAKWQFFVEAFLKKIAHAESHKSKAMIAQDNFERKCELDVKLPIEPAVNAWYVNLP